jgi:hypothetical protein
MSAFQRIRWAIKEPAFDAQLLETVLATTMSSANFASYMKEVGAEDDYPRGDVDRKVFLIAANAIAARVADENTRRRQLMACSTIEV